MKYIRYSRYTGEPADAIDLEELIKRLGDFFLQSGFESPYGISEFDPEQTMGALREAILRALSEGDMLPEDLMEQLTQGQSAKSEEELRDLIDRHHRAPDAGGLSQSRPTPANHAAAGKDAARRRWRPAGRPKSDALRDHRQDHRFSRIPDPQGFARFARQIQFPAATTRANSRPASNPAASRVPTNLATR